MNGLETIKTQLEITLSEIEAYNEKQTKASSARIRKGLGAIKNQVTAVRAELVAADKA